MKLSWDEAGSRLFETGVSKAVLYPTDSIGNYQKGVAWNGLISVTVSPEGAEPTPIYANNVKIAETYSFLDFNGSIDAFTYPDEFSDCIGFEETFSGMRFAMQKRKRFALVWRSRLGNDIDRLEHGYKIHILYNCMAQLSEMPFSTINEDPELINFSWSFSTIPILAPGYLQTSYVEIDSTKANPDNMYFLEQVLYGTDWTDPIIPLPEKLYDVMADREVDWAKAMYAILDNTGYPFNGIYPEYVEGLYPKYDGRRF